MNRITIENLRRIRTLEFPMLWRRGGVYLLTGANGSGKSTVLACLARLGSPDAFERFFGPNILFSKQDVSVYADSSITYRHETEEVTFRFDQQTGHWNADDPSKVDSVFAGIGYPQVLFAAARRKQEGLLHTLFSESAIESVPVALASAMHEIFDDEKFVQLMVIPLKEMQDQIFLVREKIRGREFFISENNFSSGERSVVHLLDDLERMEQGSLVLIDEAEMALHPKAQRRLLNVLEQIAVRKQLTILVSTHSATLIKTSPPKNLFFLESEEPGVILCRQNVYPAQILGEMAIAEEILPETILLVEDSEAAMLLEAIINKLKSVLNADFPYCKILPVGGYMQVVILLDNLGKVFPDFVKRRAVLDKDAAFGISKALQDPHRPHFDVVARNKDRIYFLPCAPEQGVIRLLETDPKHHSKELASALESPPFNLLDVMRGNADYAAINGTSRSECKDKLNLLVDHIVRISGEPEQSIRKRLYRYYVDVNYSNPKDLKEDYCSLLFHR